MNFEYLDNLISNGEKEIVLDFDIILSHTEENKYIEGIELDIDDLIIDGKGHTIDARGKTRIFQCMGSNITLKNITFKNGHFRVNLDKSSFDRGGAIKINHKADVSVINCKFLNNFSDPHGGAIYNMGKLNILESIFSRNTSESWGAAIHNDDGEITIRESTFTENTSEYGGAIHNYSKGVISIINSKFNENTANRNGGAIYNEYRLTIINSEFNENTAKRNGGAIYNTRGIKNTGELTIAESVFKENASNIGGAIYNKENLTVNECFFDSNESREAFSDDIFNEGFLTLKDLNFNNASMSILNNHKCYADNDIKEKIRNQGKLFNDPVSGNKKSFTYLNQLIQEGSSEIILNHDIILDWKNEEESKFPNGIIINKDDIVIHGNGHEIDACDKIRIFECNGKNITIKNIKFKNGFCKHYGGAINNTGELTILDSIFEKNTANKGGAINNEGKLTIMDLLNKKIYCSVMWSQFIENTASKGGAISNNGILTIKDSSLFRNTTEKGEGGALYNTGELSITQSEISYNLTESNGGAIYNDGELSIHASDFKENTSKSYGGAIYNERNLEVYSCSFDSNESSGTFSKDIFNEGFLTLHNLGFNNASKSILNNHKCYVYTDEIKDIKEKIHNQGKIFSNSSSGNEKSFTYLNQLIQEGSSEIILNHDIILDWENEEENEFPNGILIDKDNIVINGNGHIIDACGLIRIFECCGKNVTIKNITIKNGVSEYDGGAILNYGKLTITESTLWANTAKRGGAIHNSDGSILTITESTLRANTAERGGAIHNMGVLTSSESAFHANRAEYYGGAIYNYEQELSIIQSIFTDNTTTNMSWRDPSDGGGAIYNKKGRLTITESTFTGNTTVVYNRHKLHNIGGGAICNKAGALNINQSKFTKNTSKSSGGAILNCEGEFIITKSNFTENTSKGGFGGAIYNKASALNINQSEFISNWDAIYNRTGALNINQSKFTGNGGAICNKTGALNINQSEFTGNRGAIDNLEGELTITESELSFNSGAYKGGAIDNEKGQLTIAQSKLNNNTAENDGGAIHNEKGKLTIRGSELSNNIAKEGDGGAIHNEKGKLNICKSKLNNNTAMNGGAILCRDTLKIAKCTLQNNKAKDNGGIAYVKGSFEINESNINKNTAKEGDGGVICHEEGKLIITKSTINENIAMNGGIIKSLNGNFKIFNCVIHNNSSLEHVISNNDSLQIYDTDFVANQTRNVIINNENSDLSIFNGNLINNIVTESVIFNEGRSCTVERSVFENNILNPNSNTIINKSNLILIIPKIKDEGKTVLNEKHVLIKLSSEDIENKIYGEGEVITEMEIPTEDKFNFGYLDKKIHENRTKEIILDNDIIFQEYERDFYEGGIELDIDDLIIDGNGHSIDGANKSRIFIITGNNIILKNLTFKNGYMERNYDNTFNNGGGAIRNNYNKNIRIENCKFLDNISERYGGAIHNSKGEMKITDSILKANSSKDGGTIRNDGILTIAKSTLNQNAAENGGTIYNDNGSLNITGSTLSNNTAENGGTIYNDNGSLNITGSTLSNNTAENGGTIYNHGRLSITGSTLSNSVAKDGGTIYNKGQLIIYKSILAENVAKHDGGAIYGHEHTISISESELNNNKSDRYGGAIYNDLCELSIIESQFNENTTMNSGGAIYNTRGGEVIANNTKVTKYVNIIDTTFNRNIAESAGGAIYNTCIIKFNPRIDDRYDIEYAKKEDGIGLDNCKLDNNKPDNLYVSHSTQYI